MSSLRLSLSLSLSLLCSLLVSLVVLSVDVGVDAANTTVLTGSSGYAIDGTVGVGLISMESTCGVANAFALSSVTLEIWMNPRGLKQMIPKQHRHVEDDSSRAAGHLIGTTWEAGYNFHYNYGWGALIFQLQGWFADDCWMTLIPLPAEATYGKWTHVAAVWDDVRKLKQIFVNGTMVYNQTCPGGSLMVARRDGFIGGIYSEATRSPTTSMGFYGQLDEARWWKTVRTPQQIKTYMNRALPASEFSDMLLYHNFDAGTGYMAPDIAHADNEYLALNGIMGKKFNAYMHDWVVSKAPIVGGSHVVKITAIPPETSPAQAATMATKIPFTFQHPDTGMYIDNATWAGVTITFRSVSDARYLQYVRTSMGGPVELNVAYSVLSVTLIPLSGPLSGTPESASNTIFTLSYQISVDASQSAITPLEVQLAPNAAPLVGSSGYVLKCDGINDYAFADNFTWNTSWPVTVEVWVLVYPDEVQASTLFAVGNTEVIGQFCEADPSPAELKRCQGRFHAHLPYYNNLGWHYGWQQGARGAVQADMNPWLGTWTHFALTSPGSAERGTGKQQVFINGVMTYEVLADGLTGPDLHGMTLCDNRYTGSTAHKGSLDDFRIWNRVLSVEEIRRRMYDSSDIAFGAPVPAGLKVAYDFNEAMETGYARDLTRQGNDAIFGGCSTTETIPAGTVHQGIPHCNALPKGAPQQDPASFPMRWPDLEANFGTNIFQQVIPAGTTQINIILNGTDPNHNRMTALIEAVPSKGKLYATWGSQISSIGFAVPQDLSTTLMQVVFNATVGAGGLPYTTMKYSITDGILKSKVAIIEINMPCGPGAFLDNTNKMCLPCPIGTYQALDSSYVTSCTPAPIGSYVEIPGQSSYMNCTGQTFTDSLGSSACKACGDYDYPEPCIMSSDVHPKAFSALNAICIILLVLTIITLAVVIWKRHSRVIFSASTLFTSLCVIGAIGLLVSVLLLLQPQTVAFCTAKHWVFHLSFDLAFISLLAKTFRIDSIFNSRMLASTKKSVKNTRLIAGLTAFMTWDIIILAVWTAVAPFTIRSPIQKDCMSNNELVYQLLLFIPKVAAVLAVLLLAYRVRNIPALFNETSSLYIGMSSTLGVSLIVLLLAITGSMSSRSQKVVVAVGIMVAVAVLIASFIGPKLLAIWTTRPRRSSFSQSNYNKGTGTNTGNNTSSGPTSRADKNSHGDKQGAGSGPQAGAPGGVIGGATKKTHADQVLARMQRKGLGASVLSDYSLDGINSAIDDKHKRLRELETSIQNVEEKMKALKEAQQNVTNEILMLELETVYRGQNQKGDHTHVQRTNSAKAPQPRERVGSASGPVGSVPSSPASPKQSMFDGDSRKSNLEDVRLDMMGPIASSSKPGHGVGPRTASMSGSIRTQGMSPVTSTSPSNNLVSYDSGAGLGGNGNGNAGRASINPNNTRVGEEEDEAGPSRQARNHI